MNMGWQRVLLVEDPHHQLENGMSVNIMGGPRLRGVLYLDGRRHSCACCGRRRFTEWHGPEKREITCDGCGLAALVMFGGGA